MYILDATRLRRAMKDKGFRSVGELARVLGVHRNTLHYFLVGRRVLPESCDKMLAALGVSPSDALVEKRENSFSSYEAIAPIVDRLHARFPQVTFVLFGSRVRGRAHRYADWDLGVFSKDDLPHETFSKIEIVKDDLEEESPFIIDLVNLTRMEPTFLKGISHHWSFLTGRQADWIELQRRAYA